MPDVHGINAIEMTGDPMDDHNHGSHCAGIIGAVGNNTQGIAGVIWNVQIMACKFLSKSGGGFLSDAIKCMEYALENGAHLTSNSYGCKGCNSQSMREVISVAEDSNQLFIAAAGNDGLNIDLKKENMFYPAGYAQDNVISVASSDEEDRRSIFSNHGRDSTDLAAPGSRIISTVPGGYKVFSGTSMACPYVAGAAALMMSVSGISNDDSGLLKVILMETGDLVPNFAGRTASSRRLNVFNAIDTLMRTRKSKSCCEDLNFDNWAGSRLVCGDSQWPGEGGACVEEVTWQAASDSCRAAGARLCTAAELKDGETFSTGCGFNSAMVWTSDSCRNAAAVPHGGYVQAKGKDGSIKACRSPSELGARRCCADSCQVSMSCKSTATGVAVKNGNARCIGVTTDGDVKPSMSCDDSSGNSSGSLFVETMSAGGKINVMCIPPKY